MPSKNSLGALAKTNDKDAPILKPAKSTKTPPRRFNKGFQVEASRAAKWDLLVAKMKAERGGSAGPELLDEAMDYMFKKYSIN